jgi:hypothetical protein
MEKNSKRENRYKANVKRTRFLHSRIKPWHRNAGKLVSTMPSGMNNWCVCRFFTHIFTGDFNF